MKPLISTIATSVAYFRNSIVFGLFIVLTVLSTVSTSHAQNSQHYTTREIVNAGHGFFGATTGNLAQAFEKVFSKYGLPKWIHIGRRSKRCLHWWSKIRRRACFTRKMQVTTGFSGKVPQSVGIMAATVIVP